MAIIDLVRWAPQGNKTIYAYRFPETNLATYTQLIVQETQEAILFSKGQNVGKFGPGKHTLNTENLPILRNLFGIPFGGKNPFTAEVWFVNKIQTFSIDWAISKMSIHDPDYNTHLPLVAGGKYGLKVIDSEKFLINVVGTKTEYTQDHLSEQFFGEFSTKTKSQIAQYVIKHRVGYKVLSAYLDELSEYLKSALNQFWDKLGLQLLQFNITTIEIDVSTVEGQRVAEAISKQSAMSITGHTWQQEKMFEMGNNAIGGIGSGSGGLIGGLMAVNMMGGMGGNTGVGNGMMTPQYNQPTHGGSQPNFQGGQQGLQQPVREVYCSNCSKKFPNSQKFCPHCGNLYNPCPKCGTDNQQNAKRCVSCSLILAGVDGGGNTCPNCNAQLAIGAPFCGNCGNKVSSGNSCNRCGTTLGSNIKFCPKCGNKQ